MNSSQFALQEEMHQEAQMYQQKTSPQKQSINGSPSKFVSNAGNLYASLHSDDNEELEVSKPLFDPSQGTSDFNNENYNISNSTNHKTNSHKLNGNFSENKENNDLSSQYNIPNMISSSSGIKKSTSQVDIMNSSIGNAQNDSNVQYEQENFDDGDSNGNQSIYDNLTQNTEQNKANLQNSTNNSQADSKKKKGQAKRSMSKDVKILQTMKAYFPQLAQAEPKKAIQQIGPNPALNKVYGGQRSSNTSQGKSLGQHSERIIFVENRRRPNNQDSTIDYKAKQQSVERRNSQVNNSTSTIQEKQNPQTTKNSEQLRKNTQLPPINKRQQVQVLDQSSAHNTSPRTINQNKILSPLSTNQQYSNVDSNSQQHWSDKKRTSNKLLHTHTMGEQEIMMVNNVILEGGSAEFLEQQRLQQKKDYERKNQEMIQKMQEKKNQEMKMIEEQRRKLQKRQEKLKKMILQQAADVREKKLRQEEEAKKRQQEEGNQQTKKTPVKRKPYIPQSSSSQLPTQKQNDLKIEDAEDPIEEEEEKKQKDMLKKYYRSRYATFLKTIQDKNKKREEDMEQLKKKEEKKKAKLQEELGIQKVQSRFMEDVLKLNKEINEKVVIEPIGPIKNQKNDNKPRRGSSIVGIKSMTSTSNFNHTNTSNNDSVTDIQKIYVPDSQKRNRSNSRSEKRAHTPKVKKSKRVIVMPIDEKTEEDFEKEMKAKKEAAEKIKMRQQKYLQDLADRKEKETQKQDEEKKKKEKLMLLAREQAKQNFDKVLQQPGLKELQEKKQSSEDEDENGEDTEKKKKKKKKVKPEGQMDSFLERNNPKKVIFPNITDLATWKRKYKVEDSTKVFICTGGYPDIKKALKKRGWVENKDCTSPCFDLKWVLKSKDIDHNTLNDNQLVNHFNKATAITTKVGLCHNLKNLIWFNNVDIDTFYPRCFDLAMQEDLDDFIEEFKGVKAESYVRQFVREMRESMGEKPSTVNDKILKVALRVCDKRLRDLDDMIDDPNAFNSLVTDEEWAILGADELNVETLAKQKHDNWLAKNEVMQQEKKRKEAKEKDIEKKKKKKKKKAKKEENKEGDNKDDEYDNDEDVEGWNKKGGEDEEDIIDDEEDEKAKVVQDIDLQLVSKHPEYKRAIKILEELKAKYPQFNLNGEKNIWIVKPAGSSRGRGIALYNQLIEILDLCKQKESQYIAQKYIENSLIIKKRKFDIRQWVLVTNWNPLTVWVYQEPYFRFPASDYTDENIMDRFIHLTNNSVAKYAEKATVTYEIEGNMWCFEEFRSYLQEEYGWDVWEDKLKEQTNTIIINCLESVQDMFECKPGCFELFGFDLMIDEDFNMWLIEVNSSPAMDYSTPVTERLVKLVLEDTIKVIVDYAQAKKKSKVDTGLFEQIYKASKTVDKPINSFGLNLVCEGKKLAPSKSVLLLSLGLALATVVLLASNFDNCETANLKFAMGLMFLIYAIVFVMMLLQFIGLVQCLKTIPRAIMGFYFALVGVMFFVQMILFKGTECRTEAPVYYYWLVGQIALFYLIVAFGLAKWGSYICWQAETHDAMAKKAVEEYFKHQNKKELQNMIENDDKKEPLLSKHSDTSEDESYHSESSSEEDEEQNSKKGKKLPKQLAIGN